ncbi:MAG: sodium-dependent transporter [Candidatus Aminicenantes bacterium]|nr:sodium-dependent transporter [Candidatus Aminicenantes bacterium]
MMIEENKPKYREAWASRLGFILAAAGWSIGLGNIVRFPYTVGKYGGGAFLLLYLICLVFIAIPLFTIEFSLGRASQSSITTGFRTLSPKRPWWLGGLIGILGNIFIFSYYTMVIGWVFAYLFKAIKGQYAGMSAAQINALFDKFSQDSGQVFAWQLLVYLVLGVIVSRGLVRGIEAFSKIAMPVLFLMLIALGIYALTLPGAMDGLSFYLKPDFSKINGEAVIAALGQVFFSIGVGFGATWVYGSYLSKKANIPGDSVRIAFMDTAGAFLAGLIIFPAAFAFGVNPDAGFQLIFVTLPNVFGKMPGGSVFGALFFFLVSIAALTSAIAHTECVSSWIMDEFKWDRLRSRKKTTWLVLFGCFLLGIPSVLSFGPLSGTKIFGLSFFDLIDYVSVNVFLVLAGLFLAVYVGWSMGIKKFTAIANEGAKRLRIKPYWGFLIKYIIPVVILLLFLMKIFGRE